MAWCSALEYHMVQLRGVKKSSQATPQISVGSMLNVNSGATNWLYDETV